MFGKDSEGSLSAAELKRISIIRRYANVAFDLPAGAKEALSIRMGSIEVTPKDSFELYLSTLKGAYPCCDYVIFQKRFTEIFARKAYVVLKKIIHNRQNNIDYYVSNDYFGQEFKELFEVPVSHKRKGFVESKFGNLGNKKMKGIIGFNRAVAKVGLSGVVIDKKYMANKKQTQEVYPVKWR